MRLTRAGLAAATLVVLAAFGGWWWRGGDERPDGHDPGPLPEVVSRFSLALPRAVIGALLGGGNATEIELAISPGGDHIVVVKPAGRGPSALYVRAMNGVDFEPLPDTADARTPFFSPDGQWVGFFTPDLMKRVALGGRRSFPVCGRPRGRGFGASWSADGAVVLATDLTRGLVRISDSACAPERLTELREGELSQGWPDVLPANRGVLFSVYVAGNDRPDEGEIHVLDFSTKTRRKLIEGGTYARYSASGHILFARDNDIFAVAFDLQDLEVTGTPVSVVTGVTMHASIGSAAFALSADGVLVTIPGTRMERSLVSVDMNGTPTPLSVPPGYFEDVSLSPSGGVLAFTRGSTRHDVWLHDLRRGSVVQLTTDADHHNLSWSPDGEYLAFDRSRSRKSPALMRKRVDGTLPSEQLLQTETSMFLGSWSPDGAHVAYAADEPRRSLWVLPMHGDRRPLLLLDAGHNGLSSVRYPSFSPDGKWIAFVNARHQPMVNLVDFPEARQTSSIAKGNRPVWHPSGRGLFYQDDGNMIFVEVATEPELAFGKPRVLFRDHRLVRDYDIAPDGETFFMIQDPEFVQPTMNIVWNWFDELRSVLPADP